MHKMTKLACLILVLSQGVAPAWAAVDRASQVVIEQANYWQQKNRDDLAGDAWRKLLRAYPDHPVGLIQLANIELRLGNRVEAENLYNRAAKLNPPPAGLAELGSGLKLRAAPPSELDVARKQAQSGQREEAVKHYKKALGSTKPKGELGLEYYQTLGGTREGWSEARLGLEALAKSHPSDKSYMLALAKHLTYRETTRREGIRQLVALSNEQPEAVPAWRKALVWLNAKTTDRKLFQDYLSRFPDDQNVQTRLAAFDKPVTVYRPDPEGLMRQSGYKQLNLGDLAQAEARFQSVLRKHPRDSDALGGMGLVRLRQESFAAAGDYFDQAKRYDKRGSHRLDKPRASAAYWLAIQEANHARELDDQERAELKLRQAVRIDNQEPTGQMMLAEVLVQKSQFDQAETIYRNILRRDAGNVTAFAGLMNILSRTGRDSEARQMLASYDQNAAMRSSGNNQLRAAVLMQLAAADEKIGDHRQAAMRLEDALLLDPSNPWIRLSLAKHYQKLGYNAEANALLDNLIDSYPSLPEAIHARALLYAEQDGWAEGLHALERIPPGARTAALHREQHRFWVHAQVQRAQQLYEAKLQSAALRLMAEVERVAGHDKELLSTTATGWSVVEQNDDALRVMRKIMVDFPNSGIDSSIQYAGMLLEARQYIELGAVLRSLASAPERLTVNQQDNLNNIILVYTLRQADSLREAGHLAEAYRVLKPALDSSSDPRLQMALARIYNSGNEPDVALKITEEVLVQEPDNFENQLFASSMALAVHQNDKALTHAQAALTLQPNHPRALAAMGRVEKAKGNYTKAMEYFQYAQALERQDEAFADSTGGLSLRLVDEDAQPERAQMLPVPQQAPVRRNLLPVPDVLDRQGSGSLRMSRNVSNFNESQDSAVPVPEPVTPRYMSSSYASPNYDLPDRTPTSGREWQAPRQSAAPQQRQPEVTRLPAYPSSAPVTTRGVAATKTANSISDEIAAMQISNAYTVDVGSGFRNRTGEAGMSALSEIELAAEVRKPIDYDSMMLLRLTPVLLDAGAMNVADPKVAVRFGSTGLGAFLATPTVVPQQIAAGVAINGAYRTGNLTMDLGTTPLGFNVADIVGGFKLSGKSDDGIGWRAGMDRRAVTDSLLSYAGAIDPRTGKAWGGVVKTGLNLALGYDQDDAGIYASGGYSALNGKDVKSNTELELSTGAYKKLYRTPETELTVGVNFSAMSYHHNLSYFTLGHGGYFSPQRYVSAGIPFDVSGRNEDITYQVGGDLGYRSFSANPVVYYPNDPAMQTAWQAQIAALPAYATQGQYAASSVNGLGYGLFGVVEMRVGTQSAVGFRLAMDNSSNYAQQSMMTYLRYSFDRLPQPVSFPPRAMRSIAQGGLL
jgi:tetratricopeptide (TPR) repeat protein